MTDELVIQVIRMHEADVPIYLIAQSLNLSQDKVVKMIAENAFISKTLRIDWSKILLDWKKIGFEATADKHDLPTSSLIYILAHSDVDFFTIVDRKYVWPEKELLEKVYVEEYMTLAAIASAFGCSTKAVRSEFVRQEIDLTRRSKYPVNHEFFETIDTEEKAYWLGFMFADGNVETSTNVVSIKLNDLDKDHLEKFSQDVSFGGPVEIGPYKTPYGLNRQYARVRFSSPKMKMDLMEKGCVPNKTYNMPTPKGIPDLLMRHFVRGVADGDGTIVRYNGLKSDLLSITGQKPLLDFINEWLDKINHPGKYTPHNGAYRLDWNGRFADPMIEILYKDSTVFLDRKYELARRGWEKCL